MIKVMDTELELGSIRLPKIGKWAVGYSFWWKHTKREPVRHLMFLDDFVHGLIVRYKGDPLCTTYTYPLKKSSEVDAKINCPQCIRILREKGWLKGVN